MAKPQDQHETPPEQVIPDAIEHEDESLIEPPDGVAEALGIKPKEEKPEAEPEPEPKPEPAAKGDEPFAKLGELGEELAALNDNLSKILDDRRKPEPDDKREPDELAELTQHADPAVRAMAERALKLEERLARMEASVQHRETAQIEQDFTAERAAFRKDFRMTDAEEKAILGKWDDMVARNPNLADLTIEEAAARIVGRQALEGRRIAAARKTVEPGNGSPTARPAKPNGQPVATAATGGGAKRRWTPTADSTFDDAERAALREVFGQT